MKKITTLILGSIMLLAACKPSEFENINVDPTAVSSVPTKALLTNVFNGTNGNFHSTVFGVNTPVFYAQHLSEGPYPGASLYSTRNFEWNTFYVGSLYNLKTIIDLNTSGSPLADPGINGSKDNQIAVARILKAYFFWYLTDRYGDIPYSEALKGDKNFSPKYDPQKDIYYDLFKELKEAGTQIKVAEQGVSGDLLFGGDMAKWKKFAATTRLFMALRLIKNDNAKAVAEFNSAIADGVLASNAENVLYKYLSSDPNNYNPWYNNYSVSFRNDYAISTRMTDYMKPKNDPRLPVYAEVLSGEVKGLPYGGSAKNIPGTYSRIGTFHRAAGAPALVYSYAQVLFSMAEAAKRGVIAGGDAVAAVHYANGVKASLEYYGVGSGYAAYMAQPGVAYNAATGLEQIMTEKWIHLYLNGNESWTDWRRTGFPVLPVPTLAVNPIIPRRQGYPSSEPSINGVSYKEVVARQGADDLNTRVWWDK